MHAYAWPGNVRELKNRIARAAVMADDAILQSGDLFPESKLVEKPVLAATRFGAEQRAIQQAIAESGGHMGQAARLLGISRTTLWKKLRERRDDGAAN
ncbi:Regulatory protein AtoC [compost metagenome]